MGFSSGASKAERKAKKAAAAQYYAEAAKLQEINEDINVSTNNRRKIEEAGADDIGISGKARQLDRLGRAIKSDDKYKTAISNYNNRYRALKEQIAGRSVERYAVSDRPGGNKTVADSLGLPVRSNFQENEKANGQGPFAKESSPTSLAGRSVNLFQPGARGKIAAKTKYYDTEEEALAAAEEKMRAFNAREVSSPKGKGLINNIFNPPKKADATDPSVFVRKEVLPGIAVGYRQLNDFENAFSELGAYADMAQASPVNQYAERYAALTKQLNQKLKNQTPAPSAATGLLGSELATGRPTTEVIS